MNKEIVSLYSLLEDKQLLVEKLFSILSSNEIKQMSPEALKVCYNPNLFVRNITCRTS